MEKMRKIRRMYFYDKGQNRISGNTVVTLFAGDRLFTSILLVAIAFALIGLVSNAIGAGMGTALRNRLSGPRLAAFKIAIALILVASIYPIVSLATAPPHHQQGLKHLRQL